MAKLDITSNRSVFYENNCLNCGGTYIKNGQTKSGNQRYRCKNCGKSKVEKYIYNAYNEHINTNIVALTKEGVGIKSSARLLNISPTTLMKRIKLIASQIEQPPIKQGQEYELDEMRTYVKKKTN